MSYLISLGLGSPAGIREFITFGLQAGAAAPAPIGQHARGGGGSVHRGYDHKRAVLKRKKDEEFVASIRAAYRELTADPETRERAQELVAPLVPAVVRRNDESPAQYAARSEAREEALRAEHLRLDALAVETEIALRMLHQELRELQEQDDMQRIAILLAQVL